MTENEQDINGLASDLGDEVPRTYRDLLKAASFSRGEIAALHRTHSLRALVDFAGVLATTAAVPLLYLLIPNPLMAIPCVLLTIHNFNSLASIVHYCGHGKLFAGGRWNEIVGVVAAALMGYPRTGHALSHQTHHIYLNNEGDADLLFGQPDEPTASFFRMLLQDVFMISAVKRLLQYMQSDRKSYSATPWRTLSLRKLAGKIDIMLPALCAQAALVAYYWAVIGPEFYLYFYVLPVLTLYPAQIRLRSLSEHGFEAGYRPRTAEERWVTRSTAANLFERLVIVPLGGEHHFEHHLLPGVPYYNLPLARQILAARGFKIPLGPGYFRFVFRRWKQEQSLARRAAA